MSDDPEQPPDPKGEKSKPTTGGAAATGPAEPPTRRPVLPVDPDDPFPSDDGMEALLREVIAEAGPDPRERRRKLDDVVGTFIRAAETARADAGLEPLRSVLPPILRPSYRPSYPSTLGPSVPYRPSLFPSFPGYPTSGSAFASLPKRTVPPPPSVPVSAPLPSPPPVHAAGASASSGSGSGVAAGTAGGIPVDQLNLLFANLGRLTNANAGGKRLPAFSSAEPDDWIPWKNVFRTTVAIRGWDDVTARNHLANSMEGQANLRTSHIDIFADNPATRSPWTASELLAAYDAVFLPESGGQLARAHFKIAKQNEKETIQQWHARLRTLHSRADPNADTEMSLDLREQFIGGLRHPVVKDRTYNDFPRTYTEALHSATNREAALTVLNPSAMKAHNPNSPSLSQLDLEAVSNTGCWNCGKEGHFRSECPFPPKNRGRGRGQVRGRGRGSPRPFGWNRPGGGRGNQRGTLPQRGRGRGGPQARQFRSQLNAVTQSLQSLELESEEGGESPEKESDTGN